MFMRCRDVLRFFFSCCVLVCNLQLIVQYSSIFVFVASACDGKRAQTVLHLSRRVIIRIVLYHTDSCYKAKTHHAH